jgi:hypothetical protein
VTADPDDARDVIEHLLAPLLEREPRELAAQLPVGTPDHCIELLAAYAEA